MLRALHVSGEVSFAFQLRWSLSLFNRLALPLAAEWQVELANLVERDRVRLLEVHQPKERVTQFLLSTQPSVAPPAIVKSVKGRLQHLLHGRFPNCFRRNFSLTSLGEPRDEQVLDYIANQVEHHFGAHDRPPAYLSDYQLAFPRVDLQTPQYSEHGRYVFGLHLVMEFTSREPLVGREEFARVRDMVVRASAKHQHRLARGGLLPDHVHLALGPHYQWSPERVALSYMNNIAYVRGMHLVLRPSAYVGTIGPYDMNTVRRCLEM